MEKEIGEVETEDKTGFSEKQLDINVEIGIFKKSNSDPTKANKSGVIFQKKQKNAKIKTR